MKSLVNSKYSEKIKIFEEKNENGNLIFHEILINASKISHLTLLDLFFRPREIFGDVFDKIFPKKPEYQKNHQMIPATRNLLPWNGWLFRGHSNSTWKLATTFERLCFGKSLGRDLYELEQGLIRDFRRTVRSFHPDLSYIKDFDTYECMSWLQHFGGATRFLDVTYSFFVALYFAINNLEFSFEKETDEKACSIWCFNRMWIEWKYKHFLPSYIMDMYNKYDEYGKDPRIQEAVLNHVSSFNKESRRRKDEFLSVINMAPFYQNPRMIRQKGIFLLPTNIYRSFEDNLFNMVESEDESWRILKVTIKYDNKTLLFLQKLLDEMNVNSAVLFDDMEGFCRNINTKAKMPNDSLIISPNAKAMYSH